MEERSFQRLRHTLFYQFWHNPVQWTHYADRHKGLCLGFYVPDEYLVKINYCSTRQPAEDFVADLKARYYKLQSEMDDYTSQGTTREEIDTRTSDFRENVLQQLREESTTDELGQAFIKEMIFN